MKVLTHYYVSPGLFKIGLYLLSVSKCIWSCIHWQVVAVVVEVSVQPFVYGVLQVPWQPQKFLQVVFN